MEILITGKEMCLLSKKVRILLDSLIFSMLLAACIVLYEEPVIMPAYKSASELPAYEVAWWSSMYEKPNPEQLPVKVCFRWLKGLE